MSSRARSIAFRRDLSVTLADEAASATAPTDATGGGAIDDDWLDAGARTLRLTLAGAGTCTLASPLLLGWDATEELWFVIASLNGGTTINLTATLGWSTTVELAAGFTRLAVSGTLNTSTLTAKAAPIIERQ
jgi:hypothetical protein